MNCKLVCLTLFLASGLQAMAQKSYQLDSPDGKLKTVVNVDKTISFSVSHEETEVLAPSSISMSLEGDEILGLHAKVAKVTRSTVNKIIPSPFYKKAEVTDSYNGMSLNFKGNWSIEFRAYNDGLAYRFVTRKKGDIVVKSEEASYNFSKNYETFAPYVNSKAPTFEQQFFNSFEQPYVNETITKLNSGRLMILPFLVTLDNGKKLCITEADLEDFPGMFLNNSY